MNSQAPMGPPRHAGRRQADGPQRFRRPCGFGLFFKKRFFLFIYLAVPALSGSMWDLAP